MNLPSSSINGFPYTVFLSIGLAKMMIQQENPESMILFPFDEFLKQKNLQSQEIDFTLSCIKAIADKNPSVKNKASQIATLIKQIAQEQLKIKELETLVPKPAKNDIKSMPQSKRAQDASLRLLLSREIFEKEKDGLQEVWKAHEVNSDQFENLVKDALLETSVQSDSFPSQTICTLIELYVESLPLADLTDRSIKPVVGAFESLLHLPVWTNPKICLEKKNVLCSQVGISLEKCLRGIPHSKSRNQLVELKRKHLFLLHNLREE